MREGPSACRRQTAERGHFQGTRRSSWGPGFTGSKLLLVSLPSHQGHFLGNCVPELLRARTSVLRKCQVRRVSLGFTVTRHQGLEWKCLTRHNSFFWKLGLVWAVRFSAAGGGCGGCSALCLPICEVDPASPLAPWVAKG